jgi:AcrR family transcriptional regulator
MVEMVAERGYEGITVRGLARLAGVSTRSFYKHFANAEECFVATYESLVQGSLRRAYAAREESEGWEEGIRAALRSLIEDVAGHPKEARIVLVEAFAAGSAMHQTIGEAIAPFERLLIASFADAPHEVGAPRQIAQGIVAGVMRVVRRRLLAEPDAEPARLGDELGDWVLSLCGEVSSELEPPAPRLLRTNGRRRIREAPEEPGPTLLAGFGDERGRILAAVSKLALAGGYSSLTVPRIRADAGVSRRSFDARFADVDECFLEAVETLAVSAAERAEREAEGAQAWEGATYRAVTALCAEVASNAALAQLAFVEILAPGRRGVQRCEQLLSEAARRLRAAAPPGNRPSELGAEASVAAAWRIVHAEIAAGDTRGASSLAPLVIFVLLAPGVGARRARESIRDEEVVAAVLH